MRKLLQLADDNKKNNEVLKGNHISAAQGVKFRSFIQEVINCLIFGCICAGLGAFFGYIAQRPATAQQHTKEADASQRNEDLRIQSSILDEISSKNIEDYLNMWGIFCLDK
ncbi:unnamed protein product [Clavelina lepadiformis]|uniref:Uncharacterized protein n=1 Tax=Clavelina lepadiformis TaxID=159417 RepID=A0ABP0GL65_CLALP